MIGSCGLARQIEHIVANGSSEPPSPSLSRKGLAATKPAVRGLEIRIGGERRKPDDPPGEPGEPRHRVGHRARVAALEPVGKNDKGRAARQRRKAWNREEGVERVADARTAVPVGDHKRSGRQRLLAVAQPQWPRMRVSRVPMVKTSTDAAARDSACANARCDCVRSFIEPETSIRRQCGAA